MKCSFYLCKQSFILVVPFNDALDLLKFASDLLKTYAIITPLTLLIKAANVTSVTGIFHNVWIFRLKVELS